MILPFWGANVAQLRVCVTAILGQTLPHDRFELIVIDNHQTPHPDLVATLPAGCILLHEPRPGSYTARNRGLTHATGEIVAFIDSDCEPMPDWLAAGVAALTDDPGLGFIGGRIALTSRRERPNIVEMYDFSLGLNQQEYIAVGGFCATANLFTRASVLRTVGPFDHTVYSGGDRMWGERAIALGFRCAYAAEAVVLHPARATLGDLITRSRRVAAADLRRLRAAGALENPLRARRSRAELTLAATRVLRIAQGRRRNGIVATCGAMVVALLVVLVKAAECLRLVFGGRPQR